jgi:hypothetical protein
MPVPINLEKTDWRTIFRKLEAADRSRSASISMHQMICSVDDTSAALLAGFASN